MWFWSILPALYTCTTYLSFNFYRIQLFIIDRCLKKKPTSPDKATNIAVTEYSDILQGRRIIDLAYFAKMLQQGCAGCEEPLQLVGCVSERKYGLASIFQIKCHKCGNITSISSGKRQNDEKNGQGPFDVNVKLGVGMYPHIFILCMITLVIYILIWDIALIF